MPSITVYDVHTDVDVDVDVAEFWDECSTDEREELKRIVLSGGGYNAPFTVNGTGLQCAVLNAFSKYNLNPEQQQILLTEIEKLEWCAKNHDFSSK